MSRIFTNKNNNFIKKNNVFIYYMSRWIVAYTFLTIQWYFSILYSLKLICIAFLVVRNFTIRFSALIAFQTSKNLASGKCTDLRNVTTNLHIFVKKCDKSINMWFFWSTNFWSLNDGDCCHFSLCTSDESALNKKVVGCCEISIVLFSSCKISSKLIWIFIISIV